MPNPTTIIQILLDGGADINLDAGDGPVLKYAKLRAKGHAGDYEFYGKRYNGWREKLSKCPLARADYSHKQSKEEWQQKGQEAADMLLTHGSKDDANKQPVDEDIVVADLSAIFAGFQSRELEE